MTRNLLTPAQIIEVRGTFWPIRGIPFLSDFTSDNKMSFDAALEERIRGLKYAIALALTQKRFSEARRLQVEWLAAVSQRSPEWVEEQAAELHRRIVGGDQ